MEQGSKFSSSHWSMFASNNAMNQSNSRISDPKFQHKSVFENFTCHLPTKVRRLDFAMPNQKGTTADRSKSSKNLTESPKKISSTSSADKQSSTTSNKWPLSTQKLEAPGDTFGPKVVLVEETAIGYVHNLSNPRRNRGNTLDYCTFLLQTATKNVEALLYSPHKRPLLLQSQERHAPIKLTYFTYTQAKDKIIVNDMTNISTPQQSEYSFKHQIPTEPQAPNTKVLDVLNTSKEWEVVTVQGKIFGLKDQRIVGSPRKKLTLVEAFLDDGSGRIPIDIWESHIENVKTGRYCNVFKTCQKNAVLMYQSNRSFGSPPRHLNFWKIFAQMPPSLKSCSDAPTRKITRLLF